MITRRAAAVLAVAALFLGVPTAAEAHDDLVGTSPTDRSITAVVPAQVTLTFGQPALAVGTIVIVTGPAGQVQTGAAILVDNTVTEHLRPGSPAGRYTVTWRVSSADGHPVSGQFSFTATASSPSPGQQATATVSAVSTGSSRSTHASTATTAGTREHASTLWWVAGGILSLLLLALFIVTRKPRTKDQDGAQ